jgi:hypothetical protein
LAARRFFLEQDPDFLQAVSVTLIQVSNVEINVTLNLPFCKSFDSSRQRAVIGQYLYIVRMVYLMKLNSS